MYTRMAKEYWTSSSQRTKTWITPYFRDYMITILIPLTWLAVATLVLTACQVAAAADADPIVPADAGQLSSMPERMGLRSDDRARLRPEGRLMDLPVRGRQVRERDIHPLQPRRASSATTTK